MPGYTVPVVALRRVVGPAVSLLRLCPNAACCAFADCSLQDGMLVTRCDRGLATFVPSLTSCVPCMQVYDLSAQFLPKEWIMEKWEEGYYITAMAGSTGGSSLVVMSKGTPYTQQSYKARILRWNYGRPCAELPTAPACEDQQHHVRAVATAKGSLAVAPRTDNALRPSLPTT